MAQTTHQTKWDVQQEIESVLGSSKVIEDALKNIGITEAGQQHPVFDEISGSMDGLTILRWNEIAANLVYWAGVELDGIASLREDIANIQIAPF